MTTRLPSGSLGAESLVPLHLQMLHRDDWLRRNGGGTLEEGTFGGAMDRLHKMAEELAVDVQVAAEALHRGIEERERVVG